MHTFELICNISVAMFHDLLKLPSLIKISNRVYRTNFYAKKGIVQIEIRLLEYKSYNKVFEKYYLVIRCNAGVIMKKNNISTLDLSEFSEEEIIVQIKKRISEIKAFREIDLDKASINIWRANRVDIAKDYIVNHPSIIVWLCNMSFPYNYWNMKRKNIKKPRDILYFESCCFCSKSREFNIYFKMSDVINNNTKLSEDEMKFIERVLRVEIQILKQGIKSKARKMETKRSIKPYFNYEFCSDYLQKEIFAVFKDQKHVSYSKAMEIIDKSTYRESEKMVIKSIINLIQKLHGLYPLEEAIKNELKVVPKQYGSLRTFRQKWLNKIRMLGISPITIPDEFGIAEIPSLYNIIQEEL